MDQDKEAMSESEVAAFLGYSVSTIQKMRRPGAYGPPFRKMNPNKSKSKVIYLRSEVIKWRDKGRVDPAAA